MSLAGSLVTSKWHSCDTERQRINESLLDIISSSHGWVLGCPQDSERTVYNLGTWAQLQSSHPFEFHPQDQFQILLLSTRNAITAWRVAMGFFDRLEQFFDVDSAAYGREISQLNQYQLYTLHKSLQRKEVGLMGTGVVGIAAAPYTAFLSLASSGIAARRLDVNTGRIEIVEARLRENHWAGHAFSPKDLVVGLAPGMAAITLVPGANHALGLFSGRGSISKELKRK